MLEILEDLHKLEKSLEFHEIADYTVAEKFLYEYFITKITEDAKYSLDIAYFSEDLFDIVLDLEKQDYYNKLRIVETEDNVILELYIEVDREVIIKEFSIEEFDNFMKQALCKLEEYLRDLEIVYKAELFDKLLDSISSQ